MEGNNSALDSTRAALLAERDALDIPHSCHAGYILSNFGTELDAIEPFTTELTSIVDIMKEELANEARILEGTDIPDYVPLAQNEHSEEKSDEEQWKTVLPNGSLRTVRILGSIPDSNTLSCFARPNSPALDIADSDGKSYERQIPSSWGILGGYGVVTDVMNESSECTVPTINEPMPGTPNEEK